MDEENENGLHQFSDAPFELGKRRAGEEEIISMSTKAIESEDEDSGDDYGPAPPPEKKQEKNDEEGQNLQKEAPASTVYDAYRKREIQPTVEASEAKSKREKKPSEGWYVYGKDDISSLTSDERSNFEERNKQVHDAAPHGEFDMSVLMDDENAKRIPMRYEAYLRGHTKAISAFSLDSSGVRLVSAGADFHLRFWDFSSMDKSLQSFRYTEPTDNNLIHTLEWSKSGDKILLAANMPQAQVLDREGRKLMETPRGYQYTTDMTHTTGHIHAITRAAWNPSSKSQFFATCGQDATVRIWDTENSKKHLNLIKIKNEKGLSSAKPNCLCFDESGLNLAFGCDDGSVQIFASNGPFTKPSIRITEAHTRGTEMSDIQFVPHQSGGQKFATRGTDDCMKVWDVRNTSSALANFPMLPNRFAHTKMAFSPHDGSILATGTSNSPKNGDPGAIFFFDLKTLQLLTVLEVSFESVISLQWHRNTNQLLAGSGNGAISVFFDPALSQRGVMTSINKSMRKISAQRTSEIEVITPFAPQELNQRQRKAAALRDPAASHKPHAPVSVHGSDGLLGSNLKADFMKRHLIHETDMTEDPREALLRKARDDDAPKADLDYAALERLNKIEQDRAEAMEKARKSRERK